MRKDSLRIEDLRPIGRLWNFLQDASLFLGSVSAGRQGPVQSGDDIFWTLVMHPLMH